MNAPRDARPTAYVRAIIGTAAFLRAQEAFGILTEVLRPNQLRLPYVSFLPDLSPAVLLWLVGLWAVLALCFATGFQTRVSGLSLALVMGYVLLFDQQSYSNHLYLLILATALLALGNSGATFSLDARRSDRHAPPRAATVPNWLVLLLRWQLSMVYFWGAVGKLTVPFLSGDIVREFTQPTIRVWLRSTGSEGAILATIAGAAIATELFLSVAIWLPRLRYLTLATGAALHGGMIALFWSSEAAAQIQIFAVVSLALYLPSFFEGNRPQPQGD